MPLPVRPRCSPQTCDGGSSRRGDGTPLEAGRGASPWAFDSPILRSTEVVRLVEDTDLKSAGTEWMATNHQVAGSTPAGETS